MKKIFPLIFVGFIITHTMQSQTVMPLYKDSIPNSKPVPDEEKTAYENGITIISKISRPTLTIFLPKKK